MQNNKCEKYSKNITLQYSCKIHKYIILILRIYTRGKRIVITNDYERGPRDAPWARLYFSFRCLFSLSRLEFSTRSLRIWLSITSCENDARNAISPPPTPDPSVEPRRSPKTRAAARVRPGPVRKIPPMINDAKQHFDDTFTILVF